MVTKYSVLIEGYTLGRLKEGNGDIALFDTLKELENWLNNSGDIDTSCIDYKIVKIEDLNPLNLFLGVKDIKNKLNNLNINDLFLLKEHIDKLIKYELLGRGVLF